MGTFYALQRSGVSSSRPAKRFHPYRRGQSPTAPPLLQERALAREQDFGQANRGQPRVGRPLVSLRPRIRSVTAKVERNLRAVNASFRQRRKSAAGRYAADVVRQLRIATVLDFVQQVPTVQ